MKFFNYILSITISLFAIYSLLSCKQELKSNEFNIYVSKDNPGWHFVDITFDTIHKGYYRLSVKFAKGQKFQTAIIRSDPNNFQSTFLYNNGDTVKSGLWFNGLYSYDSPRRDFVCFYMPTEIQRRTIKEYWKDSSYNYLRYEMDTIVENYLRQRNEIK